MSKNNGLRRHYDKLGPEERFRLDVLATARGDKEESERLVESCGRRTYTMNDRAFTGRWTGTYEITLRMHAAINNGLAKLDIIDAVRQLVPYSQNLSRGIAEEAYLDGHKAGSRHSWGHAGKAGDPPAWPGDGPNGELMEPDEDERDPAMDRDMEELDERLDRYGGFLPEILDRLERDLTATAFSLWEGFAAFCREDVGVAPEKVVAVVLEPVVDRIQSLKDRAERLGTEADDAIVRQVREGLGETWRMVERRGV